MKMKSIIASALLLPVMALTACTKNNAISDYLKQKQANAKADTIKLDNPNATIDAGQALPYPPDSVATRIYYYRKNYADTVPYAVKIERTSPKTSLSYSILNLPKYSPDPNAITPASTSLQLLNVAIGKTIDFFKVKREATHSGNQDNYKSTPNDRLFVTDFPASKPSNGLGGGVSSARPVLYKADEIISVWDAGNELFTPAGAVEIDTKVVKNANNASYKKD